MTEASRPTLPPRLLVLTDRTRCAGRTLAQTVDRAVNAGARAVVLREKDLPADERAALARELSAIVVPAGGLVILAGAGSSGHPAAVHLAAADRMPVPRPTLVGRSCHGRAEIAAAAAEGCDYVTVSPVFATASKPGYGPALGLHRLAELCAGAPPGYALGGVSVDTAGPCVDAGARGIAIMGPVMRDPDIVAAYLAALPENN